MRGMFLEEVGRPLRLREVAPPSPNASEVLVRVRACAVCRTDLHVVDGELAHPKLPLVPGHEIVGVVEAAGPAVTGVEPGTLRIRARTENEEGPWLQVRVVVDQTVEIDLPLDG